MAHDLLGQHVLNARAKLQKDEDSRMRMVKKAPNRKIDAGGCRRHGGGGAMYLNV